jgi:hypothetical protein
MTRKHGHRLAIAVVVAAVLAGGVAPGASAEEEGSDANLVVNPGADMGLEGWDSTGWAIVAYGSSASVPPATFGSVPGFPGPQPDLFQAQTAGSTMSQDVSLARYAPTIESSAETIYVALSAGSAGSNDEGAEMLAQPEDGSGGPLGAPTQLGPPTAIDRKDQATLIDCHAQFTAPVGTRSVLLTLEATGAPGQPSTAMADSIYVVPGLVAEAAVGPGYERAQGQNCYILAPLPSLPPPTTGPSHSQDPGSAHTSPSTPAKPLTRAEKLAKALVVCKHAHTAKKRRACAKAAEARYGRLRSKTQTSQHSRAGLFAG